MAIKDWKQRKVFGLPVWKHKHSPFHIYITWYGSQGNMEYDVRLTDNINLGGTRLKHRFKSISSATKYARSYMRTH